MSEADHIRRKLFRNLRSISYYGLMDRLLNTMCGQGGDAYNREDVDRVARMRREFHV